MRIVHPVNIRKLSKGLICLVFESRVRCNVDKISKSSVVVAFREKPSRPPNKGQLMELPSDYRNTMRQLATNSSYLLLLISYGINTGTFYAVSTLLSQVSSKYYPVSILRPVISFAPLCEPTSMFINRLT